MTLYDLYFFILANYILCGIFPDSKPAENIQICLPAIKFIDFDGQAHFDGLKYLRVVSKD